MEIVANYKITVSPAEVESLPDALMGCLVNKGTNVDICVTPLNPKALDEKFWQDYDAALGTMATMIVTAFMMKQACIAVDVLTDAFAKDVQRDPDLVVCEGCPCKQCLPDRRLFKHYTGHENVPPEFFCRKSFLELRHSSRIAKAVTGQELSDVNEQEWREFVVLKMGGLPRDPQN